MLLLFVLEFILAFGLLIKCLIADNNSIILWEGILVAIPTAIPVAPFANKLGNKPGNTVGSIVEGVSVGAGELAGQQF